MEVRLTNKRKLNGILKRLGYEENPSFETIFDSKLCKEIVKDYWENLITKDNRFLFSTVSTPQNFLKQIKKHFPGMKQQQTLALVGLLQTAKDGGGVTGLRKTLGLENRAWYRIVEQLRGLDFLTEHEHEWINDIETQISTFEAIKLQQLRVKYCKV